MLPVYRKELRKILLEKVEWMHEMKKDSYYRKIMKTRQDLIDVDGYDWMEATEAAIYRRMFSLNKLFTEQAKKIWMKELVRKNTQVVEK